MSTTYHTKVLTRDSQNVIILMLWALNTRRSPAGLWGVKKILRQLETPCYNCLLTLCALLGVLVGVITLSLSTTQ